jgi:hypothetical protein
MNPTRQRCSSELAREDRRRLAEPRLEQSPAAATPASFAASIRTLAWHFELLALALVRL